MLNYHCCLIQLLSTSHYMIITQVVMIIKSNVNRARVSLIPSHVLLERVVGNALQQIIYNMTIRIEADVDVYCFV